MSINKGGRGKKAPYKTVIVRVPVPIVAMVQQMIDGYRLTGNVPELTNTNHLPSKDDLIAKSEQIIKSKKSARQSLEKLINYIYSESDSGML